MDFEPITPRLSSIPKSVLLTSECSDHLSAIITDLDAMATKLKIAGVASYKEVAKLSNNVLSVADALEDGIATIEIMRNLRERMTKFDEQLPNLESEYARTKQLGSFKGNGSYHEEIMTLSKALNGYRVDDSKFKRDDETAIATDIQSVLDNLAKRNKALQRRLPRSNVEKYALVQLPVILISGNRLDKREFERLGFQVDEPFQGYPVLEDQILLAINTKYARDWDMNTLEVAEEIVNTLSQGSIKLTLVDDAGRKAKGSTGFMYYWVMPERYYHNLIPKIGEFEDWGIAA